MSMPLPAVGSIVAGKYRIEGVIGSGGMGAVLRAHHELMDKPVALKWLHPRYTDSPDARDRFLREARAAARLKHPNVVEIHDVSVHEGALFMVMELLQGETFEQLLERAELSIPETLRLLLGAMRGVAAAHERGIIHRDVKPENIFVAQSPGQPNGIAKILDFGISKLLDDSQAENMTKTGTTMGTPAYMSYEHMTHTRDVDIRTDVYSFGVILYRVLTGVAPFEGESLAAIAVKVATYRPPSPCTLRPELPLALDAVVLKAMARDRDERFPNITALIAAVEPFASEVEFLRASREGTREVPRLFNSTGPLAQHPAFVQTRNLAAAPTVIAQASTAAPPGPPARRRGLPALAVAAGLALVGAGALWFRASDSVTRSAKTGGTAQRLPGASPPPLPSVPADAATGPALSPPPNHALPGAEDWEKPSPAVHAQAPAPVSERPSASRHIPDAGAAEAARPTKRKTARISSHESSAAESPVRPRSGQIRRDQF